MRHHGKLHSWSTVPVAIYFSVPHTRGGALPCVGGYQVPVNRPPFFTPILHPMTPFFYSVHTQWPPFFHFCIKFYIKIAHFCALRAHFEKFNNFCGNLNRKFANFALKLHFCTLNDPHFWESTSESPHFLGAHTEWPLFSTKSYTECPLFSFSGRHLYVTFIFECPPPGHIPV